MTPGVPGSAAAPTESVALLAVHGPQAGVARTAVAVALVLAYLAIGVGAAVLIYYIAVHLRELLVRPYRDRWWYFAVGVAAAIVYAVSGLVEVTTAIAAAEAFRTGATLFFFLFGAVGVRGIYVTAKHDRGDVDTSAPWWSWPAVLGAFIVAWWGAYLLGPSGGVALVETVGLAGAVTYTLAFAVLTVRDTEGTTIAAFVRHFAPALAAFALVVAAETAGRYTAVDPGVVLGVELVGTVLVGAFLFTSAIAISQQCGEVSRLYDETTWRGQELE